MQQLFQGSVHRHRRHFRMLHLRHNDVPTGAAKSSALMRRFSVSSSSFGEFNLLSPSYSDNHSVLKKALQSTSLKHEAITV